MTTIERIPLGIPNLDQVIEGGVPKGTTTLLLGEPGTGKTTLIKHFITQGLKKGESVLVIISGQPASVFVNSLIEFDSATKKNLNKIILIDLYPWRSPFSDEETDKSDYKIEKPADLQDLNRVINETITSLDQKQVRIAIDSISDILLFEKSQSVFKLMQLTVAKIQYKNFTGFAAIEKGMHHEKDENTLDYIFHNLIEMKLEEGKRHMRVKKMISTHHTRNWLEYTIDKNIKMEGSPSFAE